MSDEAHERRDPAEADAGRDPDRVGELDAAQPDPGSGEPQVGDDLVDDKDAADAADAERGKHGGNGAEALEAPAGNGGAAALSRFGGPDDESGEHAVLVGADGLGEEDPLGGPYDVLEIRTPIEEFEAFGRARLESLVRLGQADQAEVTGAALELGLRALRRVMGGVASKETP